jgi:uncharacterized sporulation protein YeaH/YhbH (DUF444 family)
MKGDRIARPKGGGGGGSGQGEASDSGEGEDDFAFTLTREEFLNILFEDLELPNMFKQLVMDFSKTKPKTAGHTSSGSPENMHVVQSMKRAIGRRIATGVGPNEARRQEILKEREVFVEMFNLLGDPEGKTDAGKKLLEEISYRDNALKRKGVGPYFDPIDLRYRGRVQVPKPESKALMMCLMDISGSMDEPRKIRAKLFFLLLELFLERHYGNVEKVYIRHHTQAKECSEEDFYHSKETGGTIVSSALVLAHQILMDHERYPPDQYNVYIAQASDGDNWGQDSDRAATILKDDLLPLLQYFMYIQVVPEKQDLWDKYAAVQAACPNFFGMQRVTTDSEIYPAFRELLKKKGTTAPLSRMEAPVP